MTPYKFNKPDVSSTGKTLASREASIAIAVRRQSRNNGPFAQHRAMPTKGQTGPYSSEAVAWVRCELNTAPVTHGDQALVIA